LTLLSTIYFAGVGAVDDLLKIRARHSDGGLSRTTKLLAQGGFGSSSRSSR
jgi:UDP-N-acetylmuramyl pentapeptide phosphotransferase/UDP-N-acetylglucosamine-1-phosphate transferase